MTIMYFFSFFTLKILILILSLISCLQELFQEYVVTSESHTVCRMDGCDKDYRDRKCLVRHIGSTHNKVSWEL